MSIRLQKHLWVPVLVALGFLASCPPASEQAGCGDGLCTVGETCANCIKDCGACRLPDCGDKACNGDETCLSCAEDCGRCNLPACGDQRCLAPETCANCAVDCGVCASGPVCDDGFCSAEENCDSCVEDCGPCNCQPDCQNRVCGSDACRGLCGSDCDVGEFCTAQGQCEPGSCLAQCAGRECGPDGCRGQCTPGCNSDQQCSPLGVCESSSGDCGDGFCDSTRETIIDCPEDCSATCQVVTLALGNVNPLGADLGTSCQSGESCKSGSCLTIHPKANSSAAATSLCSNANDCLVTGCSVGHHCALVANYSDQYAMNKCVPDAVTVCPHGAPSDCLATGDNCTDHSDCCTLQCNESGFVCGSLIAGCGDHLCNSVLETAITCPQDCNASCRVVTLALGNVDLLGQNEGDYCQDGSDCKSGACLFAKPRPDTAEVWRRWCTNSNLCQPGGCGQGMSCALVADSSGQNAMYKCVMQDVVACAPGVNPDCDPEGESCSDHDQCCSQYCDMNQFECARASATCPDGFCDVDNDELMTCPQDCAASCRIVLYDPGNPFPLGSNFGEACNGGDDCKSGVCMSARPTEDSEEPWRRWCSNAGSCTSSSCGSGYHCVEVKQSESTTTQAHCVPNDINACPIGADPDCAPPGEFCVDAQDCCSLSCNMDFFVCD